MGLWGRIFAAGYDFMLRPVERAGMSERRAQLLSGAHGRVLEVGAGTGANLAHYPDAVRELTLAEPEAPMATRLKAHVRDQRSSAQVVQAPAEALPFADDSFDTAVVTLVLCTVDDPARALSELHRVLVPRGRLLFIEHVRADEPRLARWQDRLHPLWVRVAHGCHCNRPTESLIAAAPFDIERVEHGRMAKAGPLVAPLIWGVASAR